MKAAARVIVVVLGLVTLMGALQFIFMPQLAADNFAVHPISADGWGTVRADLGGPFLGIALFIFWGARSGESKWLLVPVVFMATFLVGRSVEFIQDGVSRAGMISYVIEGGMLILLEGARRILRIN